MRKNRASRRRRIPPKPILPTSAAAVIVTSPNVTPRQVKVSFPTVSPAFTGAGTASGNSMSFSTDERSARGRTQENAAWRVAISNRFIAGADSDEVFRMLDGTAGWPVEFFRIGIAEVAGFWNGGCT